MRVLAGYLQRAACDCKLVEDAGWQGKLASAVAGRDKGNAAAGKAMNALGLRLAEATAASTDELIHLHNLSGRAARKLLDRVAQDYGHDERITKGAADALGGLFIGAVSGLGEDLMAGGLMLGGGMILGGILGALGATTAAKGLNMARGKDGNTVPWAEISSSSLSPPRCSAILRSRIKGVVAATETKDNIHRTGSPWSRARSNAAPLSLNFARVAGRTTRTLRNNLRRF